MSSDFASGKTSESICDVCGFQYKLLQLKPLTVNLIETNILACPSCWTPDQPQLQLGRYVIVDPQALRDPRPDQPDRAIQYGWNPVGFEDPTGAVRSNLVAVGSVGTVTVVTNT